jgi:hypothetical protein
VKSLSIKLRQSVLTMRSNDHIVHSIASMHNFGSFLPNQAVLGVQRRRLFNSVKNKSNTGSEMRNRIDILRGLDQRKQGSASRTCEP